MADPTWVKRTAILTVFLGVPALALLVHARGKSRPPNVSYRVAVLVLVTYFAWVLNVLFEFSTGFMIAWPLLGVVLSLIGAIAARGGIVGQRQKMAAANLLLLALHLASIIAPN